MNDYESDYEEAILADFESEGEDCMICEYLEDCRKGHENKCPFDEVVSSHNPNLPRF